MKVLFYGLNYAPELTGIGKYSGEMCEWLTANGHDIRVICAPPYYPEWQVSVDYHSWQYKTEQLNGVTVMRIPLFVPKQPKTLTRLIHLASFAFFSFPMIFKQWLWKPDLIICIEPTFFCVPGAILFSKLRRCKSLLHIQDFELDAMLGLGLGKTGLIAKFAGFIEHWFMRKFDVISSISYSMLQKTEEKLGVPSKTFFFPNWVDTDFLSPAADSNKFRELWNIEESTKIILYSGNMGKKQGLEIVLEAADRLKSEPNLLFLMVGSGAALDNLIIKADELALTNLVFYPLQAYEDLPQLMALADIHLVIQKKGAADAVLPSKLTSILSVGGNSIITAEVNTELGLLCSKFPGIARCIEPENAAALAENIQLMMHELAIQPKQSYNLVARQYALDNLQKDQVLNKLVNELSSRVNVIS
ncbi:MAG: glycosyltransferase WbuB [Methylococcaceae bacterium]|jgi:colanic acid biosynthesis glycosyl transferase WcaI